MALQKCEFCNSKEFITEPNSYDVLIATEKGLEFEKTEQIQDYKIFCRECGEEFEQEK